MLHFKSRKSYRNNMRVILGAFTPALLVRTRVPLTSSSVCVNDVNAVCTREPYQSLPKNGHVNSDMAHCWYECNCTKLQKWTANDDLWFDKTVFLCMFSLSWQSWPRHANRVNVYLITAHLKKKLTPIFFKPFAIHDQATDKQLLFWWFGPK